MLVSLRFVALLSYSCFLTIYCGPYFFFKFLIFLIITCHILYNGHIERLVKCVIILAASAGSVGEYILSSRKIFGKGNLHGNTFLSQTVDTV